MATSGEDLMLGCNTAEAWKEKMMFTTEGDHAGAGFPLTGLLFLERTYSRKTAVSPWE